MLSPAEIDRLQILLQDELLLQVINKVFEETIKEAEPRVSEVNDDLQLGQKYRAYEKSKEILRQGFIDLYNYRSIKNPKELLNNAR